jgi:hypothetical protein
VKIEVVGTFPGSAFIDIFKKGDAKLKEIGE